MDGTDIELNSVFPLHQLWWAGEREDGKSLPFLRVSELVTFKKIPRGKQ